MEPVYYPSKHPRRPADKVVSFEEYCHQMESGEPEEMPSVFERSVRRRGRRKVLEYVCLLLEAGVCLAAIVLMLSTVVRLLTR